MSQDNKYRLIPLHLRPDLVNGCVNLLNACWPLSPGYRTHTLENSHDHFPTSLVFVDTGKKPEEVIGHVRLRRVVEYSRALFLTSVIIHENYRGNNLGKLMMKHTEDYARNKGFNSFYLTTSDSVGFYRKCGYNLGCSPVQPTSGNLSSGGINDMIKKFNTVQNNHMPPYSGNIGMMSGAGDASGETWMFKDF